MMKSNSPTSQQTMATTQSTSSSSRPRLLMKGRHASTIKLDWGIFLNKEHDNDRGDFTLAGSVRLAKRIEEQVKASGRAEQRKGSKFVYFTLLLAAIGFAVATYYLIRESQEVTFRSEFESYARETADIAENNAANTFGQLKALATAITSIANHYEDDEGDNVDASYSEKKNNTTTKKQRSTFPKITIPHFDLRAQEIADLTGIEMISFVPFVPAEERLDWQQYAVNHQHWIQQDYLQRGWNISNIGPIPQEIYNYTLPPNYREERRGFVDDGFMEEILYNLSFAAKGFKTPVAQFGPGPIDSSLVMMDLFTHPIFKKELVACLEYDVPVISETEDLDFLLRHIYHEDRDHKQRENSILRSFTLDQVKENFEEGARTVGVLVGVVPWETFFRNLLPENVNGIVVKVASDCGKNFTYIVNGGKKDWSKDGDYHDPKYDYMAQQYKFFWKDHPKGVSRHCHFDLIIYPSEEFQYHYRSNDPIMYAFVVVAVCAFMALVFCVYNQYVQHKQNKVMSEKARTNAVISALFPPHVCERLMADEKMGGSSSIPNIMSLSSGTITSSTGDSNSTGKPLADLFPSATVMFADIAGFTAWSSEREPSMVFTLLESIYQSFDHLSQQRRVFKVETIGDCYVAVAGLPDKRPDHALVMASFARDCLLTFQDLVRRLSVELGPGTEELGLRTGIHSGPVTAGVLRGESARFQLFGDTVNVTARIESLGKAGRIHLSHQTAEELKIWNKEDWLVPRPDQVEAKGKGLLTTYWLVISDDGGTTADVTSGTTSEELGEYNKSSNLTTKIAFDEKKKLLVDWNAETLLRLLEKVVASRRGSKTSKSNNKLESSVVYEAKPGKMVIDEVAEIITIPVGNHSSCCTTRLAEEDQIPQELSTEVSEQLHAYVARIAQLYPENPFHNFTHASHVSMSVAKLLSRIVAPNLEEAPQDKLEEQLHDHTYRITSDPLVGFACVFSSLIHDVEHTGLPNSQLVAEGTDLAIRYNNISVAEQNSVEVAWSILMEPDFEELRSAIYSTQEEMVRFRQLVVNSVMATDIVDGKLKALRNARWEKAFTVSGNISCQQQVTDDANRKATIVIEHLIQASDVSHTMQHWHIFRKWNENLFREMYAAFKAGRSEKDPSEFWYEGEIGFFQFYIIPLAKKLKECGVFGVSSDEYLNYAEQNLNEWRQKGKALVQEYIDSFDTFQMQHRDNVRLSLHQKYQLDELDEKEDEFAGIEVEC